MISLNYSRHNNKDIKLFNRKQETCMSVSFYIFGWKTYGQVCSWTVLDLLGIKWVHVTDI